MSARHFRVAAGVGLVIGLAAFYLVAATEHASRVNTFKARGDQAAYLAEAKHLHANWNGLHTPSPLPRNRMPLYPAYLAVLYDTRLSDDEFFTVGKALSIRLSLVLLGVLYVVFRLHFPPLVAVNLLLTVAFGYFVFKAGYVQAELLFYTFFLLTFVASCHAVEARTMGRALALGATAGALAALAHLTKAAMLPFVTVLSIVMFGASAVMRWRIAAGVAVMVSFLGVLSPYLLTSKRVYGRYFHNVNSTFYVWYDNWPAASVGTYSYGDHVGWPTLPRSQIPGPARYWREHTVRQILARLGTGFEDMGRQAYQTFWFFKLTLLYVLLSAALICSSPRRFAGLVRDHAPLVVFLILYAAVYLLAIAFYHPISGTGTARFLLAHLAPLLFAIAWFATRTRLRDTRWTVAGIELTPAHVQLLITATIALDMAFTFWPRLMGTYGGF